MPAFDSPTAASENDPPTSTGLQNTCPMALTRSLPWYCPNDRVDAYRGVIARGGNPTMIQAAKVLRTIMLNAIVGAIVWGALEYGGDPTIVPTFGLLVLGVINGFEYSDWAAFRQAYHEAATEE